MSAAEIYWMLGIFFGVVGVLIVLVILRVRDFTYEPGSRGARARGRRNLISRTVERVGRHAVMTRDSVPMEVKVTFELQVRWEDRLPPDSDQGGSSLAKVLHEVVRRELKSWEAPDLAFNRRKLEKMLARRHDLEELCRDHGLVVSRVRVPHLALGRPEVFNPRNPFDRAGIDNLKGLLGGGKPPKWVKGLGR